MPAQEQKTTNPSDGHCPSIDDLLKKVTEKVNHYEAMKLPALKAELEAFQKKLDATVKDYRDKYPALRDKWCSQQQVIQTLAPSIKCAIVDWKSIVEACICSERQNLHCKAERIRRRKRCSSGPLQRASAEAQSAYDAAKARLDALGANAQGIAALQSENDKLIKDITAYLSGDKLLSLNAFFFKLLPNQKLLTPADVPPECKTFGDDEAPAKLCPCDAPCPPEPDGCTPPNDAPSKKKSRHGVPWLIEPDKFKHELECAWYDYHETKDAFAQADAAFKAAPDDIASLEKELDDLKKSSDDRITQCLKGKTPDDSCCKKTATTTAAE